MKPSIIICGAGVTGVSAAYHLARAGVRDILLVDERPPLSLTSDRSTEWSRMLAAHVTGATLPTYASAFHPSRFDDPAYLKKLEQIAESGQL
jgi:glycine/D-amino acid oxidase-like deaminating enzyme